MVSEKWGHVAAVLRMFGMAWVIMIACIVEMIGAVSVFMDVDAVEVGTSLSSDIWHVEYLCFCKNSAVGRLIEAHASA